MRAIEEKQYIISKIQDILNKIEINQLTTQKELEELQKRFNDITNRNNLSEFENQENKTLETLGIPKSQERIDKEIISELNKYYESKLLLYTYLIDLKHIDIKNHNNLEKTYLKYRELTSKIQELSNIDRSQLFTEKLFYIVLYEIAFNKSREILNSISDKEIFDIYKYLKENINKKDNPKLYKKLNEDIIDREELYEILSVLSKNTFTKEQLRLIEYEEKQNQQRKSKLEELKEKKVLLEQKSFILGYSNNNLNHKMISQYKIKLNDTIREFENYKKNTPKATYKSLINIAISASLMITGGILFNNLDIKPIRKYLLTTQTSNNLDYNKELLKNIYLEENYIQDNKISSSTKMTVYGVWKSNIEANNMYTREVFEYEIDNLDLDDINDYFTIDTNLFRCTNKYIETKSKLSEEDLYSSEYIEIEKTKLDLENYIDEQPSKLIKILLISLVVSLIDILSALPKYFKTDDIILESESYELITGLILLIKNINQSIDYNQIISYYNKEIKKYQNIINNLLKEEEEILNREENTTIKLQIIETKEQINNIEKIINMIEKDEYYTVYNEHVTTSGKKLKLIK